MVNQKTIADELGVSVMTVSRALRNHPDLSQATKDRIISKAVDLGYTKIPAQTGKSFVKRAGLFMCQDDAMSSVLNSGVSKQIFMSIEEECRKHQIEVVVQVLKPGDNPVSVKNKTIDAAFLLGRYTVETAANFSSLPTVAVSSFIAGLNIPCVTADNQEGARLATQHLLDLGHRDIVFAGQDQGALTEIFRVRSEGYALAMIQNGLKPVTVFNKQGGNLADIMPYILKSTGVVCSSDSLAIDIKQQLTEQGLRVPEEISIAGFDNLENTGEEPGNEVITTYAPNWAQLGHMGVDLLIFQPLELLKLPFKLIVPGKLLIRKSTGPVRKS
ncbi:MAG: LacI family DNA-binding transcriptional regulator [Chthoniobacteraceae bacterium]